MIRLKLVIRNVFSKPLRSVIIILSLAAAAFASLFCISGIYSAQSGLSDFFRSMYGTTDIMISGRSGVSLQESDLPAGSQYVEQNMAQISFTTPNPRYFNYITQTKVSVIGMDTDQALKLQMIDQPCPTQDGITMTKPLADMLNKKVGDTFTFTAGKEEEFNLRILAIVMPTRALTPVQLAIVTTPELSYRIANEKEGKSDIIYVDVPDDKVQETMQSLSTHYPDYSVISVTSDDAEETMGSMLNVYYLIFAVVILMVCFIVVSLSRHIVNERMSVIGMLRSIGGSIRGTGLLLLAESSFYGICGSVLGVLIFLPFRGNTDLGLFATAGDWNVVRSDGINLGVILLVIIAVTLIQCLFSATAILKAARTPVRDIIFGTKETAYRPSTLLTCLGALLLIAGIIFYGFFDGFEITILAAFCSMIGAVLLFPRVIRLVCYWLIRLYKRTHQPVAGLAVRELATTKSSISTTQLIFSAISLTIAVLVLAVSLIQLMSSHYIRSEIMVTEPSQYGSQYDYLSDNADGIQDIEKLYYKYLMYDNKALLNGAPRDLLVMGYQNGGYRYFNGIKECPAALEENEIAIDRVLAGKLSLRVGDEVTLKLNLDKYYQSELKLRIKCFIDGGYFNSLGNTVMMNLHTYQNVYFDNPAMILVKTEPGKEFSVLQTLQATLPDNASSIRLTDEYFAEAEASMSSILTIVYAVAVLGLALSLMGSASNLLMSFEQSRRKYAVFYSTSMSKSRLKKMILLQTLFTNGLSAIAAVLFGMYFLRIINKALSMIDLNIPLIAPMGFGCLFGLCAFVILLIVVIKPIRMLSRMNMAEEIKTSAD